MSDNTINAALRAIGFAAEEVTGHGFRATARTMLHERLGFSPDVIEAQLAHAVRDSLGRAYNRTEFIDQRRQMLQAWADYLDKLRTGNEMPGRLARSRTATATSSSIPARLPSYQLSHFTDSLRTTSNVASALILSGKRIRLSHAHRAQGAIRPSQPRNSTAAPISCVRGMLTPP